MGTSYHITFEMPNGANGDEIQASIDARLDEINNSMSTYQDNSTINKFNALNAGQTIQIDPNFIKVLSDSRLIYEKSHHSFDPTVHALVELWGFGAKMSVERLQNPPTQAEILAVRNTIGLDKIVLNGNELSKTTDGVGLDFSAIAKGYGVDMIADILKSKYNINNYMVEIGGEIATNGVNDKGLLPYQEKAWQPVAITATHLIMMAKHTAIPSTPIRQPLSLVACRVLRSSLTPQQWQTVGQPP